MEFKTDSLPPEIPATVAGSPEQQKKTGRKKKKKKKNNRWNHEFIRKRLVRTVLIFTESSDQLSRATDRVPGLPASPGYVQ